MENAWQTGKLRDEEYEKRHASCVSTTCFFVVEWTTLGLRHNYRTKVEASNK